MCVALVSLVLDFLQERGLFLKAESLQDFSNPLKTTQQAQISVGVQPKPSRIPPVVSDSSSVGVFLANNLSDIPCSLLAKLQQELHLYTLEGQPVVVPKYSRFLRFKALTAPVEGGEEGVQSENPKRKFSSMEDGGKPFGFEVAFGLPWSHQGFMQQACKSGHPSLRDTGVPDDLKVAVEKHVEWTEQQLASYRISWCRRWVARAQQLEKDEEADAQLRDPEVARLTKGKRLLLTKEILDELQFEDTECLKLLSEGATLAGPVQFSPSFQSQYKPCLATLSQLENNADKMNAAVLKLTSSSGSLELDQQLLEETRLEVERGWAEGPYSLDELPRGATVSRRFALSQGSKVRMIDDFSISGVNDSCEVNNKLDLHMIDTFCSLVKLFFRRCAETGVGSGLRAKTYDLKSAYRQVPVRPDHYKYAFFSIYNHERGCNEIYKIKTMPFGATHSVYNFLRLSKMLHTIAVRGLFLLCTNFYDDFVLASKPSLVASASSSMELVFRLTGWVYAEEGSKATQFDVLCRALGVQFDFNKSEAGLMYVSNTESRRLELVEQITTILERGTMEKQETLSLRGRLGFADSFIHGRVGKLLLKNLVDHAYGVSSRLDANLQLSLRAMLGRLSSSKPRKVTSMQLEQWFVYTDASFEQSSLTGGLGGVLVDSTSKVCAWFAVQVSSETCLSLGAADKGTIIFDLELLATVLATAIWCSGDGEALHVIFGDNDGVRFSLIRATTMSTTSQPFLEYQLRLEADCGLQTWYARVPTEANISDWPSRLQAHELLVEDCNQSIRANLELQKILSQCLAGSSSMV